MKFKVGLTALFSAIQIWAAGTVEGNVDPAKLLTWVQQQKAISSNLIVKANGKDMNNGGTGFCKQCSDDNSNPIAAPRTISLYQTSKTVFFEADMDIDCDGSDNGVCGGTDPSHDSNLSCDEVGNGQCSVNAGGPVDASTSPFYVLPVGSPFNFSSKNIAIGQIAAIINRNTSPISLVYAPFLDEDGVSQEIGEGSAALASLLGIRNSPSTGGQDTGLVYIVFTGSTGNLSSIADMANHQKAITTGQTLAAALVASIGVETPFSERLKTTRNYFRINNRSIELLSNDNHQVSVFDLSGKSILTFKGSGEKSYSFAELKSGSYIIKTAVNNNIYTSKLLIY